MTYQITSDGFLIGEYDGESKEQAIVAMVHDAGYQSISELCDAGCTTPENIIAYEMEAS